MSTNGVKFEAITLVAQNMMFYDFVLLFMMPLKKQKL